MMITPDFAGVFLCQQKVIFLEKRKLQKGKMHDTGE